ncbi:hypothetical protein BU14_0058s0076 [Porphyra umbilicalis]|uniref:Peptidase S1 domain-containing protein n=1 Tax=Porphyra umbilicalis TaxID=2786 RepID=A0A1X6PHA1_PORUM|nr:hypothetical protein BU14_0058s0076 [Porphyra umbilicalis]|eukprot:OSX80165.1 hypothetical protein BU14_0058s0076 [Porphyra umbilicalis]
MVFARGLLAAAAAAAATAAAVTATTLPSPDVPSVVRVGRPPAHVGSIIPAGDYAAATSRTARFLADAAAAAGVGGASRTGGAATLPATAGRAALSPLIFGGVTLSRPEADMSTRIARLLRVPPRPGRIAFSCTGLLVTERHVVTLASCPYTAGQMVAVLGGIDVAGGIPFNVSSRVIKPTFVRASGLADVAVWTFDAPAFVDAAALRRGGIVRGKVARNVMAPRPATRAIVGGWGVTDPRKEPPGDVVPDALKVTLQNVVSTALCRATFRLVNETLPVDLFCAVGVQSGPCSGDEGAPLGVLDDGEGEEFYFVGLAQSFFGSRTFLCNPNAPAVYTRLSAHLDFLARAVRPYTLSLF